MHERLIELPAKAGGDAIANNLKRIVTNVEENSLNGEKQHRYGRHPAQIPRELKAIFFVKHFSNQIWEKEIDRAAKGEGHESEEEGGSLVRCVAD